MTSLRRIGFIGLGNMGCPMATRVAAAGFDLTVYDLNPERSLQFVAQHGGKVAASLADLGRHVEAVVTMLPLPCLRNCGITARAPRYMALRLVFNTKFHSSSVCSWIFLRMPAPALL